MSSLGFQKTFGPPKKTPGPKTIEELKQRLGFMDDAVAERTEWGAVARWLVERPEAQLDPAKAQRLHRAVIYYMDALSTVAGLPTITGGVATAEYLEFHRSRQSRIKKTALEQIEHWRAAGQPCLDASISYVFWFMTEALRRMEAKERSP